MRRLRIRIGVFLGIVLVFWLTFPSKLFNDPTSTIITDSDGKLLSARIADDGQWRFPEVDSLPENLKTSILLFEDEYFNWHPGVNPISIGRALIQNIKAGKTVSGGSTITMQVIRLSRKGRSRTVFEKLIESYLAIRTEFSYSKDEILRLYASNAPYGGNLVGVEAASWRYFNRPLEQLSWAEVSMLAVLPNAPSFIHPGKNSIYLKEKRDRLLAKLLDRNVIDSKEYSLSLMEPIPDQPNALPDFAFHLLDLAIKQGHSGQRVQSTVDRKLQQNVTSRLNRYVKDLSRNGIHNACAVAVDMQSSSVLAYIGNASILEAQSPYVDIVQAARSSGSILKPFLYAKAIESGLIHTSTLLRDVPVNIGKFSPENFDKNFDGVVSAGEALSRSLNIPATLLLKEYGLDPFHADLNNLGFTTINRSAGNYGLTLILGGAEVKLWDLAKVYAMQGSNLLGHDWKGGIKLWKNEAVDNNAKSAIDPGAWWLVSEALSESNRPDLQAEWKQYADARKIAWKTGTSQGFRDAWVVGYDANFLVAVWVGNADGEGRPGLTGVSTAAPLMFEIFQLLPEARWFNKPEGNLHNVDLCATSGMTPTQDCPIATVDMPMVALVPGPCKFHQRVLINENGKRVYKGCETGTVKDTVWFALDPVAGYFYDRKDPAYQPLPPLDPSCGEPTDSPLSFIYPLAGTSIIVPKNFKGEYESVQLKATHTDANATIYWHIDEKYLGATTERHLLLADVAVGRHLLTIMDDAGNRHSIWFTVQRD